MDLSAGRSFGIRLLYLTLVALLSFTPTVFLSAQAKAFDPLAPPKVTARAVFSVDVTAGVVLYELNPDERLQPASTTKIATALVVIDHVGDLNEQIEITADDMVDRDNESHMGVEIGESWTVEDLLYGLMIPSGNDAALALARHVGGQLGGGDPISAFVSAMNELVASMELPNTHFTNPIGLADDPDHYTSARDLSALAARLMESGPLRNLVREKSMTVTSDGLLPRELTKANTNELLGRFDVHGIKTGSTGVAGGCLVIASWAGGSNQVISVLLGSNIDYSTLDVETGKLQVDDRWPDMESVLEGLTADYRWIAPSEPDEIPGLREEMAAWQVELRDPAAVVVPLDRDGEFVYRLELGPPGEPDSQVGSVLFFVGSEQIAARPVFQATVG